MADTLWDRISRAIGSVMGPGLGSYPEGEAPPGSFQERRERGSRIRQYGYDPVLRGPLEESTYIPPTPAPAQPPPVKEPATPGMTMTRSTSRRGSYAGTPSPGTAIPAPQAPRIPNPPIPAIPPLAERESAYWNLPENKRFLGAGNQPAPITPAIPQVPQGPEPYSQWAMRRPTATAEHMGEWGREKAVQEVWDRLNPAPPQFPAPQRAIQEPQAPRTGLFVIDQGGMREISRQELNAIHASPAFQEPVAEGFRTQMVNTGGGPPIQTREWQKGEMQNVTPISEFKATYPKTLSDISVEKEKGAQGIEREKVQQAGALEREKLHSAALERVARIHGTNSQEVEKLKVKLERDKPEMSVDELAWKVYSATAGIAQKAAEISGEQPNLKQIADDALEIAQTWKTQRAAKPPAPGAEIRINPNTGKKAWVWKDKDGKVKFQDID